MKGIIVLILLATTMFARSIFAVEDGDGTNVLSGESILRIVIGNPDLEDGYYDFEVNYGDGTITYPVHLYTFNGDQDWTSNMVFGDADDVASGTAVANMAKRMVIARVNGDLTVGSGVTVRPYYSTYGGPKGFMLFVTGKLTNKGIIDNSHGAYAYGENVYLWRNLDGTYEYVPAVGGAGVTGNGAGAYRASTGKTGGSLPGTRATGGGGSGSSYYSSTGGPSAAGTSYSGGAGGGAKSKSGTGQAGGANGGKGGDGLGGSYTAGTGYYRAGGGAGNPGGGANDNGTKGNNGTGGLLIIFADDYENTGSITAKGTTTSNAVAGGGSSGGGSINIFTNPNKHNGTLGTTSAAGGAATGSSTKGGAGGAGNVKLTQLYEEGWYDPTLASLGVEGYELDKTFDPNDHEYTVVLDKDDPIVTVTATPTREDSIVFGTGPVTTNPIEFEYNVMVTSYIGDVSIYTLRFERERNDISVLNSLLFNGEEISGFSSNRFNYEFNVPYTTETADFSVVVASGGETIDGLGVHSIENGRNDYDVVVTSEDGTKSDTYHIVINRPHNSKLKSIYLSGYDLDKEFDPEVTEYEITVPTSLIDITVETEEYDDEASISLSGFAFVKQTKTATITVTEPHVEPTTYTITINKEGSLNERGEITFSYTGDVQTFVAPYTGNYKIELWGAQGPGNSGTGGKGAYTSGEILLQKGETLYVYVGNRLTYSSSSCYGTNANAAFNGTTSGSCTGGGGATDIRLVSGETWYDLDSLKSRIMVAGAGGGAYYSGNGGYAGGLVGQSQKGEGATQTAGGSGVEEQNLGQFGIGGIGTSNGGGGYYGGGGGSAGNGGGGSSYISGYPGSIAITSAEDLTPKSVDGVQCEDDTTNVECSYHYSGKIFADTVMKNGNEVMPTWDGTSTMTGNTGNGYAKISYSFNETAANNMLRTLTTSNGTWDNNFYPTVNEYTITEAEPNVRFEATTYSNETNVFGIGNINFNYGYNHHNITVTNVYGYVTIYSFDVFVKSDENSPLLKEYDVDSNRGRLTSEFDSNIFEYNAEFYQDNFLRYVTYDVDDDVEVNYTNDYDEETEKGTLKYTLTRRIPVNKPEGLVDASRLDVSNAVPDDNPGITLNNDKFDIYTSGYKITIIDKGLEEYVGCGYNTENKCVGFLVDFGTKVDGIKGYGIEPQDYDDAPRWGATTDTAFIMWLSKNDGGI